MKIEFDTLWCAKKLAQTGFSREQAEQLVTTFTHTDYKNLYSAQEVDMKQANTLEQVFERYDRIEAQRQAELNRRLEAERAERREDFKQQLAENTRRIEAERADANHRAEVAQKEASQRAEVSRAENRAEMRSMKRWIVGTLITGMFAMTGYLSALIHMYH